MSKAAPGHIHGEEFCLMKYASNDRRVIELIWNSRNGVTPLIVKARDGQLLTHVDWAEDRFIPDHKPNAGDRIFVDMTMDRALDFARLTVLSHYALPATAEMFRARFSNPDNAIAFYAKEYYGDGAQPDLIDAANWKMEH